MKLTLAELAREAETTPSRIDRLVACGIVEAGADGLFGAGDVQRARLVEAFEGAGITPEHIGRAIADHQANLDDVGSDLSRTIPTIDADVREVRDVARRS